ncbi:SDR family NAD(P)-dependent oxidoreductase [Streptacidiphilus sp. PAMC 29251]
MSGTLARIEARHLRGKTAVTAVADRRRLIDVNLMGVVHGLDAILPRLPPRTRPTHTVNTASMAGLVPTAGLTACSAAKAAVVARTEAVDIELIGTGARVSALCPGVIGTGIIDATTMRGDWQGRRARAVDFCAKRGMSPDVVAAQALSASARGRRIIPTPRYQVVPHWWLRREFPRAGRGLSKISFRFLSRDEEQRPAGARHDESDPIHR